MICRSFPFVLFLLTNTNTAVVVFCFFFSASINDQLSNSLCIRACICIIAKKAYFKEYICISNDRRIKMC